MNTTQTNTYAAKVDLAAGLVCRSIFVDRQIYEHELERIFRRCWIYLGHESEIPRPGDYILTGLAGESVILCRRPDGEFAAHLNSCRHRGNRLCRTDAGNTSSFVCPYHGWRYNLRGELAGLPGAKRYYLDQVDRKEWGLTPVPQLSSYGGLIFGCLDRDAISLDAYLGEMRWGLDLVLGQGELVALPGTMRWKIECNWKFAADNAAGDIYHAHWTHRSAMLAGHRDGNGATLNRSTKAIPTIDPAQGFTALVEYGHAYNADYVDQSVDLNSPLTAWRRDPQVQAKLGSEKLDIHRANQNVFPNLFVNTGARDLCVRVPLGPTCTELRRTILVDKNADPRTRRDQVRASNRHFGPAGMFEQDDAENWEQSTAGAAGLLAKEFPLHYGMAVGRGDVLAADRFPTRIESIVNEHAQLWFYRAWAEYMAAENWADLRANHSVPGGRV